MNIDTHNISTDALRRFMQEAFEKGQDVGRDDNDWSNNKFDAFWWDFERRELGGD